MDDFYQFQSSSHLTFDTVESERSRLLKQVQGLSTGHLSLDLSPVAHCDSAGLAWLFEVKRLCDTHHLSFQIEGIPKVIDALAEFCGVEGMLKPWVLSS